MQKIEFNDEIYYEKNGKYLNSEFVEVETSVKQQLTKYIFSKVDYKTFNEDKLMNFIYKVKESKEFSLCKDICLFGLDKYLEDDFFVTKILPILTSCYRNLYKPQEAIDFAKKMIKVSNCESSLLYTSLASAYCDLKDYKNALKHVGMAYRWQGGGVGYKNETSLVYDRIKKEMEENDIDFEDLKS